MIRRKNKKHFLLQLCICVTFTHSGKAQDLIAAANKFIGLLDSRQKALALYPFIIDERYNFHFFPKDNRKGISINDLNTAQQEAAFNLMKTSLSDEGVKKAKAIMDLETVLKALENRPANDH